MAVPPVTFTAMAPGNYTLELPTGLENLTLIGAAASGTGNSVGNVIQGNNSPNVLIGLAGNDQILGGGGADQIFGGPGSDDLTGQGGDDEFYFDAGLSAANVDDILDFNVADDRIFLNRTIFTGIAANGTLAAGAFRLGTTSLDANDRILYDAATGEIRYDADGLGGTGAVLFVTVTAGTALTNADFVAYS